MVVVNISSIQLGLGVDTSNKRTLSCCCCRGRSWWLNRCHEVIEDLAGGDPVVGHAEDHLHVVCGTTSTDTTVKSFWCCRGDEIVVLAGVELQTTGSWCERSEGDGEIHEPVGLVADGNDGWLRVGDAAGVKLLTADTVDDVLLGVLDAGLGGGADDVGLVVLPWFIASVDVDDVVGVVNPEHGVSLVPVNVVKLLRFSGNDKTAYHHQNKAQTLLIHCECFFKELCRLKMFFLFMFRDGVRKPFTCGDER